LSYFFAFECLIKSKSVASNLDIREIALIMIKPTINSMKRFWSKVLEDFQQGNNRV